MGQPTDFAKTPHTHAELLRAAADDVGARFQVKQPDGLWSAPSYAIAAVLGSPTEEWKLYTPPEVVTMYYVKIAQGFELACLGTADKLDLEEWDLKVTYTDGKPTAVEQRNERP